MVNTMRLTWLTSHSYDWLTYLNTGVTILSEFSGQEFIELSLENSVLDKFPLLADLVCHDCTTNTERDGGLEGIGVQKVETRGV